jgi:outer membrane protein assembly factor BamB
MIEIENQEKSVKPVQRKPLRLWPGVLIVIIMILVRWVIPLIIPNGMIIGIAGGMFGSLAVAIWWAFFSRAPRIERWGAFLLIAAALFAASFLLDKSIATANMGLMFIIYSIPGMSIALVIWAVATSNLKVRLRRGTMVLTIILASGIWIFLRTNGMTGDGRHDLDWRWAKTNEDRLLAQSGNEPSAVPSEKTLADIKAEWPGFRGTNRDGIVHGIRIRTDWKASPPEEMWRRKVGPGCSSFAIRGSLLYTQEQRGEFETVSCYSLVNGKPLWKHQDQVRFYDSHAGAGPRSTPTLSGSSVYTLGATGILNVLDMTSGSLIWTRNAASDAGVKVLTWGFSASPLVVGDIVIVALAGKLAAYNIINGEPLWYGPDGGTGYSSPELFTFSGVPQVLLMSEAGAISVDPTTGEKLWNYSWPIADRILQPSFIANSDLLLTEEYRNVRRISVTKEADGWNIKEKWTSSEMKLLFNDCVVNKDYAYGFDGPSLTCLDLNNGKRMWRGGRYRGWLLLLADQDLLLVLTEKGELALVPADPAKFTELCLFPAIKGKTWNHPALAGNILVVRNSQEMAAYKLPLTEN